MREGGVGRFLERAVGGAGFGQVAGRPRGGDGKPTRSGDREPPQGGLRVGLGQLQLFDDMGGDRDGVVLDRGEVEGEGAGTAVADDLVALAQRADGGKRAGGRAGGGEQDAAVVDVEAAAGAPVRGDEAAAQQVAPQFPVDPPVVALPAEVGDHQVGLDGLFPVGGGDGDLQPARHGGGDRLDGPDQQADRPGVHRPLDDVDGVLHRADP